MLGLWRLNHEKVVIRQTAIFNDFHRFTNTYFVVNGRIRVTEKCSLPMRKAWSQPQNLDANCFLVMCKSHVPGGLYQCVAMGNPWQNGPFQWKKTQVVESLHWLVWFPEGDQNSTDMVGFFSWFNLKIADKMWLTWRYGWIRILTVLLPRRSRFVRHFFVFV